MEDRLGFEVHDDRYMMYLRAEDLAIYNEQIRDFIKKTIWQQELRLSIEKLSEFLSKDRITPFSLYCWLTKFVFLDLLMFSKYDNRRLLYAQLF